MRECKGKGSINIVIRELPIQAVVNENYKDGEAALEDALCDLVLDMLPAGWSVEIKDVSITSYEEKEAERED